MRSEIDRSNIPVTINGPNIEYGNTVYVIKAGSKSLTVEVTPARRAKSWLENTDPSKRTAGETTAVYLIAKQVLSKQAQEKGQIIYELETGYTAMKRWAETTGQEIFSWNSLYPTVDDPEKIVAQAIIG